MDAHGNWWLLAWKMHTQSPSVAVDLLRQDLQVTATGERGSGGV